MSYTVSAYLYANGRNGRGLGMRVAWDIGTPNEPIGGDLACRQEKCAHTRCVSREEEVLRCAPVIGSLALGCGEVGWWVFFVLVEFFLCKDVNEIKYLGCKLPQVCDHRGDEFDGCGTDLPPELGLEEGHQRGIDCVLFVDAISDRG